MSERLWETGIKGELIQMKQTEQCWCMSLCESNQRGLYWDLNHDSVHPDYFLKGHEFASPYLVARDIIFILFSSIKSFLALSFGCQSDKKFRHMWWSPSTLWGYIRMGGFLHCSKVGEGLWASKCVLMNCLLSKRCFIWSQAIILLKSLFVLPPVLPYEIWSWTSRLACPGWVPGNAFPSFMRRSLYLLENWVGLEYWFLVWAEPTFLSILHIFTKSFLPWRWEKHHFNCPPPRPPPPMSIGFWNK